MLTSSFCTTFAAEIRHYIYILNNNYGKKKDG